MNMLAKDLISDVISPLQLTDTGSRGLHWMDIFRISHLPLVDHGDLLGLISDVDIFDRNMEDGLMGEYPAQETSPFVYEYQHLYEVIEMVSRLNLTAVPVLTEENKYLGVITLRQIIQAFGELVAVKTPGGILVLELNANDYSLSQIARIVEDNNAKMLSCHVTSPRDSVKMEITLKIDRVDLTSVIQSFVRYEYVIKASYQSNDRNEEVLRNNYDQFMMYLNV